MNVEVRGLYKSFPGVSLFAGLDLDVPHGQITCLLGPSGCGKTTLLHLLTGALPPDAGTITPNVDGQIGFLFQESRLLPWMTVLENTMYLMDKSLSRKAKVARARELLVEVQLQDFGESFPDQLSGGMARRAALARVLGKEAPLVLMDEPFSSLDSALKEDVARLMGDVLRTEGRTVLCVTHDEPVARVLGDRAVFLDRSDGLTVVRSVESL